MKKGINQLDVIEEALPSGHQLPFRDRKMLYHIRTEAARTRVNLVKRGIE